MTIFVFGLISWIHLDTVLKPFFDFSVLGLGIIVIYNLLAFSIGKLLMNSKNKYIFINFIMANIFFKIVIVMFYILVYVKLYTPLNKYFLLPFVGIYLVYAVFETYFLYQMVNLKQRFDEQI